MPTAERLDASRRGRTPAGSAPVRLVVAGVGVLLSCWMLLMPPGSGPDEPGHVVRAGAVIRGEFADLDEYELPDRYQVAEPACYAFDSTAPATCAIVPPETGADLWLTSRAGEYPVWGHVAFGVLTVVPGLAPIWWARLVGAAIAVALVGVSLATAARRSFAMAAALLIGITPMAWSTFGTVNPSSIAIAGAVALWVGLLVDRENGDRNPTVTHSGWLTAAGWAALVLPRRDGLVWACLALVIVLLATERSFMSWWRSSTRAQQAVIVLPALVTVVWGAMNDTRSTRFVVLAPLAIGVVEGWRWWWHRPAQTRATRIVSTGVVAVIGLFAAYTAINTRPGGWDTDLAVTIVMRTDEHLVEAIGVLGWLDAPVPAFAVYLWVAAIGMLAAIALARPRWRTPIGWAATVAGTAAASAWVLELVQGNSTGQYWQGRYSLPLLVGLPLLLTLGGEEVERGRSDIRSIRVVGVAGLLIANIGAWAAARRFGVGTTGSLLPWRWDTPIQPVPPVLLLAVMAAASIWLAWLVLWAPSTTGEKHG